MLNQLHAVSRTQEGRQREPNVKTLRSPLSAQFSLCIEWQSTPERRNGNINLSKIFHFLEWGSNPQPVDFTVRLCAAAARLASVCYFNENK